MSTRTLSNLIQITNYGIDYPKYREIVEVLETKFKEIYGNDIDISSNTADGIYIREIAVIFNNMVETFVYSYKMHDPTLATGHYLDIVCGLSNVRRKLQSNSTCYLYLRTKTSSTSTPDKIVVTDTESIGSDGNNITWSWNNYADAQGNKIIIPNKDSDPIVLEFTADSPGSFNPTPGTGTIESISTATHGSISSNLDYDVWQLNNANPGNNDEDDSSLRDRRVHELTARAQTTLEGISVALLQTKGIKDCYVIQNTSNSTAVIAGGISLNAHQVLVVVRKQTGLEVANNTIGEIIYNKITPGIQTGYNTSVSQSLFTACTYSKPIAGNINENIIFGIAIGKKVKITINCNITANYSTSKNDKIKAALLDKLNNFSMTSKLASNTLMSVINKLASSTSAGTDIMAISCNITDDNLQELPAQFTYFNYALSDISITIDTTNLTLTVNINNT